MMEKSSADQFVDAETPSGIGCPPSLAYDQIISSINQDLKEEPRRAPVWRPIGPPVGRGQMLDAMRQGSPHIIARGIEREIAAVPGLKYDDSWLVPRQVHKNVEPKPIQATSSHRPNLQYTQDVSHYVPYDPSEPSKGSAFVMKDDDFPPL